MSEIKTKPKQESYIAQRNLCTLTGKQIKKGETFKCNKKEAEYFQSIKAV